MDTTPRIPGIDLLTRRGLLGPYQRWSAVHGRQAVEIWISDPDEVDPSRLATELERSAGTRHPSLWQPRGSGKTAWGHRYVVLPAALPEDLRTLGHGTPLPLAAAFRLVAELGGGLQALHAERLVMGALHPAHIRVHNLHADPAVQAVQIPVLPSAVEGPPHVFLAPEAAAGHVGPAADQYFLGIVLYAACCGMWPMDGPSDAPMPPMAQRAPTVDVPAQVDALARRLAFPDPQGRFESIDEAMEEFATVRRSLGLGHGPGRRPADRAWLPMVWLLPVLAAGVAILSISVAILATSLYVRTSDEPAPPAQRSAEAVFAGPIPTGTRAPSTVPGAEAVEAVEAVAPAAAVADAPAQMRDAAPTEQAEELPPPPDADDQGDPTEDGEAPDPIVLSVTQSPPPPDSPTPTAASLFDPSMFAGTYRGSRNGRPFDFVLDFHEDGTISGTSGVTVGPRQMKNAVGGSWSREGPEVQFTARDLQGSRPATYTGTVHADGRAAGTWSDGKRASGEWKAQR